MIAFIAPNPAHHLDPENSGTYNGYVAIPPEHCARYVYDIDPFIPHVHGGITYHKESENSSKLFNSGAITENKGWLSVPHGWFILGFDTNHCGDSPEIWNEQTVMEETIRFRKELESITTEKVIANIFRNLKNKINSSLCNN